MALEWLRENYHYALCSKGNRTGFRLWPAKICAFWAIEYSETENHSLRLMLESFSDGTNGPIGLAREIWRKIFEKDEHGERMGNALRPDDGVMICVERRKRKNAPPLDWVRLGRIPQNVDAMLEKVSPVESSVLCPLERVIYEPTVDEQWEYLGRLITPKLAAQIRATAKRRRV